MSLGEMFGDDGGGSILHHLIMVLLSSLAHTSSYLSLSAQLQTLPDPSLSSWFSTLLLLITILSLTIHSLLTSRSLMRRLVSLYLIITANVHIILSLSSPSWPLLTISTFLLAACQPHLIFTSLAIDRHPPYLIIPVVSLVNAAKTAGTLLAIFISRKMSSLHVASCLPFSSAMFSTLSLTFLLTLPPQAALPLAPRGPHWVRGALRMCLIQLWVYATPLLWLDHLAPRQLGDMSVMAGVSDVAVDRVFQVLSLLVQALLVPWLARRWGVGGMLRLSLLLLLLPSLSTLSLLHPALSLLAWHCLVPTVCALCVGEVGGERCVMGLALQGVSMAVVRLVWNMLPLGTHTLHTLGGTATTLNSVLQMIILPSVEWEG